MAPRTRPVLRSAPLLLALLAACRENPNAMRNQGEDCGSCHRPGGKAPETEFTVSGSVFRTRSGPPRESGAAEVALVLTGADGSRLELKSNPGGNFYSQKPVGFPVQVTLRQLPQGGEREGPAGVCAHGNCNLCHSYEKPTSGAKGQLLRPD